MGFHQQAHRVNIRKDNEGTAAYWYCHVTHGFQEIPTPSSPQGSAAKSIYQTDYVPLGSCRRPPVRQKDCMYVRDGLKFDSQGLKSGHKFTSTQDKNRSLMEPISTYKADYVPHKSYQRPTLGKHLHQSTSEGGHFPCNSNRQQSFRQEEHCFYPDLQGSAMKSTYKTDYVPLDSCLQPPVRQKDCLYVRDGLKFDSQGLKSGHKFTSTQDKNRSSIKCKSTYKADYVPHKSYQRPTLGKHLHQSTSEGGHFPCNSSRQQPIRQEEHCFYLDLQGSAMKSTYKTDYVPLGSCLQPPVRQKDCLYVRDGLKFDSQGLKSGHKLNSIQDKDRSSIKCKSTYKADYVPHKSYQRPTLGKHLHQSTSEGGHFPCNSSRQQPIRQEEHCFYPDLQGSTFKSTYKTDYVPLGSCLQPPVRQKDCLYVRDGLKFDSQGLKYENKFNATQDKDRSSIEPISTYKADYFAHKSYQRPTLGKHLHQSTSEGGHFPLNSSRQQPVGQVGHYFYIQKSKRRTSGGAVFAKPGASKDANAEATSMNEMLQAIVQSNREIREDISQMRKNSKNFKAKPKNRSQDLTC